MTWKATLYDYVHCRNQMDIDYTLEPMLPFVLDNGYLQCLSKQQQRRLETDKERRLIPVKSEIRLVINRVAKQSDSIVADVSLKRKIYGRIAETTQEEERLERERVMIFSAGDEWVIRRIDALQPEEAVRIRPSAAGSWLEVTDEDSFVMRAPSVPLLNREIVSDLQFFSYRGTYNREAAVAYADQWWDKENPAYLSFDVNCTNYVSQCLFAGGAPMNYTGKRDSGWWFKGRFGGQELWSFSWSVADSLQFHLLASRIGLKGQEVSTPQELDLGDVISYDWDGNGRFQHSTIVTAKDPNGMPLVNAHTVSSKHRYWSYTDSPAWTERTRYRFTHIADNF